MKHNLLFLMAGLLVAMLLLFCNNDPVSQSTSEDAKTDIKLRSFTFDKIDTVIVDSVNRDIGLMISYEYGYYIDSVYIEIYLGTAAEHGTIPDSQFVIRFGPDDPREDVQFTARFTSQGSRHFIVRTFRRNAKTVTATATAQIFAATAITANHPPKFIPDAPRRVYYFRDGDPVAFPVGASDIDGDMIRYNYVFESTLFPRGEKGTLENMMFTWQPQAGDKGIFPIRFSASDSVVVVTTVTTVVIGDTTFNSPPQIITDAPIVARSGALYEYQPEAVDYESAKLSWRLSGTVPDGMNFDSLKGQILWVPQGGIVSGGPLLLEVFDDGVPAKSDSQSFSIKVEGGNRPPVAVSRIVATGLDEPVEIQLFATDPDDQKLTFEITGAPGNGVAIFKNENIIVYTPASGFKGVDTIRFVARDALQSSDTATLKIYVASENQKPVAVAQQIVTREDTPLSFILVAEDVEAEPLTYKILRNPSHGAISGARQNRQYTPDVNFFGADTLTFIAYDGVLESDPAMMIVGVTPVNDSPGVTHMGVRTEVGAAVTINLTVSDPDDSVFTFEFLDGPRSGTLDSSHLPGLRYIPANGFKGADTVNYRAIDAHGLAGAPARIVILVGINNTQPVAQKLALTVVEDSTVAFTLQGSDAEGSALSYEISTQPKNGSLTGTGVSLIYRPKTNFFGVDSLFYKVSDGSLVSEPAVVSITVSAVNDLPVVQAQSVTTGLNSPVMISLTALDIDDTSFTFLIDEYPHHGILDTAWVKIGRLQYTPEKDYNGSDTVRFIARDASGGNSKPAAVFISVAMDNQRPVANPQNVAFLEDETRAIFLTGADNETSNLIYTITRNPLHGSFEGALPNISYKPSPNYNGVDTFYFTVNDGSLTSDPARVVITITPVNDPPTAVPQVAATQLNTPVVVTLQANDVDDPKSAITYQVTTGPRHGTVDTGDIRNARLRYIPAGGYKGYDTIFYRARDGALLPSESVRIVVGVALDNQPPVAFAQTVTLREDEPRAITLTGQDLENSPLNFTITQNPRSGRLENSPPNTRYIPNQDFNGADTFRFTVSDGSLMSAPAVVNIVVQAVNDPPVGVPQSDTTGLATTLITALSGTDVDGGVLTYQVTKFPAHGTLDTSDIRNAWIRYTPEANFRGSDTVLFVVRDQSGSQSAPTPLVIGVALGDRRPTATPQQVSTPEDVARSITLSGSDPEGAALTFAIYSNPKWGTLTGSGAARMYLPGRNVNGLDTFMFTVNDGLQNSEPARVIIGITAVNDTPVANTPTFPTVSEDTPRPFVLGGSDVDGNALTYTITAAPAHGTITGTLPNGVYSPALNFSGTDAFAFVVSDTGLTSAPVIVNITIAAVNDAPVATPQSGLRVDEDGEIVISLAGADVDNVTLTAAIAQQPVHGTATLSGNSLTYRPAENYSGPDSLRFTVNDGSLTSAPATVGIVVDPVNDAPVVGTIANQTITQGGSFAVINLDNAVTDPDNADGQIAWSASTAVNLNIAISERRATVTVVNGGWTGSETVTFTATDPGDLSDATPVQFSVVPDLPPTISPISDRTILMDGTTGAIAFTVNDDQTPPASLIVTRATSDPVLVPATNIVLGGSGSNRTVTVTPATSVSWGTATITLTVSDGISSVNESFVLTVNAPPVATQGSATVTGGDSVTITLTGTDPEGGALTFAVAGTPQHGALTGTPPVLRYKPAAGYSGADAFTFTVTDAQGAVSVPATVSITVTSSNAPPTATDTTVHVSVGGTVNIVLLGNDPEGATLTYQLINVPYDYGTISGSAPNLVYEDGNVSTDNQQIIFRVSDGTNWSAPATVTIIVDE